MKEATRVPEGIFATLDDRTRGPVLIPDTSGFDEARRCWNARFDRSPGAILRCRGNADVMEAVRFVREHGLFLAVRGGGHDFAGHSTTDGGLLVDLSLMQGIRIDPAARRAWLQPGVLVGAFDHESQAFGLASTGGTVSGVGVAGYTLGGGTGYLARRHGLAVDTFTGADVVTASGELVRADPSNHPDLFWALRGGGGNFGIVTSFERTLHPVGPEIMAGQVIFPFDQAREGLHFYREFMAGASDDLTVYPFFLRLPPLDVIPSGHHGEPGFLLVAAHVGSLEAAREEMAPLLEFGDPFFRAVDVMSYLGAQQMFDAGMPAGQRRYSKAQYFDELSDGAIDTLLEWTGAMEGPFSAAYFEPMGGAINRVPAHATAFPHRDHAYSFHLVADWTDPAEDDPMREWAGAFHDAMAEHAAGGVYVNLLSEDEGHRHPEAWMANHGRLGEIKARYDPDNLFRGNQNIEPSG
jgi:FAD/FMN-containing dehydrogenase